MSEADEYKQWIITADKDALVQQLGTEIKQRLVVAQNLLNTLTLMANPTPKIQQKIASGEWNEEQMLEQVTSLVGEVFEILDFFRDSLH